MSEPNESQVIEALEAVKAGVARLDAALAAVLDDVRSLRDVRAQLADLRGGFESIKSRAESLDAAVAKIEAALHSAMNVARDSVCDPSLSPEDRVRLHACVARVFSEFGQAGFEVYAPEIGSRLDESRHACVGTAKSSLGPEEIADVVAWGYSFPSGDRRLAEVLVGSGSPNVEVEEPDTQDAPSAAPKAGISMRLDEPKAPEKKKKATAGAGGLFDQLAEAAKRNQKKE